MARSTVDDRSRRYVANFLAERPRGHMYQAIVLAQLVDELTAQPVRVAVEVKTDLDAARTKVGRDGIAGIVGVPSRLFPRLDTQPYPITVEFRAAVYLARRVSITVPQQPTFPATFDGIDLTPLEMHRRPVVLTVRAMELDPQGHEVASVGATVAVTGIWRTLADLASSVAPVAPNLVAVRPGLSRDRNQPGTTLQRVTLNPIAEPDRVLTADAPAGATRLEVSRTGASAPNLVLGIDRDDPDRVEHITIANVIAPNDPNSPATVVLAYPLQHRHGDGAPTKLVTVVPLGPMTQFTADAAAGDATVFVATAAPFVAKPTVRISDGAAVDEYATVEPYRGGSDGDGYVSLPPLHRVRRDRGHGDERSRPVARDEVDADVRSSRQPPSPDARVTNA